MIAAKLNQPFSINQEIPGVPLKEVLDVLSDKYGLTFIVDVQSFETATGNRNVEETNVRLPKMPGVTLHAVLRHLLAQVQGTFIVRGDHLEVAHLDQARLEAYGNTPRPVGQRSAQPLVNVACEQRPLDAVLTDVARQAGRNVVLDARVTGREKLVVTAVLLNAPTDTAVRVLAELANLKSVQLDNVFFVTTRELAAELQAEQDKRAETQSREPAGKTPPPAVPKGSGPPMP
jgi:hypothetical protein